MSSGSMGICGVQGMEGALNDRMFAGAEAERYEGFKGGG